MGKKDYLKSDDPNSLKLPQEATDAVAGKLRSSYAALLDEPIPDRFLQLLDDLDARTADAPDPDDDASQTEFDGQPSHSVKPAGVGSKG